MEIIEVGPSIKKTRALKYILLFLTSRCFSSVGAIHTLPPLDLTINYHSSMYELLDLYYVYKLEKRINLQDKKWYSERDVRLWKDLKLNYSK